MIYFIGKHCVEVVLQSATVSYCYDMLWSYFVLVFTVKSQKNKEKKNKKQRKNHWKIDMQILKCKKERKKGENTIKTI